MVSSMTADSVKHAREFWRYLEPLSALRQLQDKGRVAILMLPLLAHPGPGKLDDLLSDSFDVLGSKKIPINVFHCLVVVSGHFWW
jgi:hypothetical protein